jgi:hypothetical protein
MMVDPRDETDFGGSAGEKFVQANSEFGKFEVKEGLVAEIEFVVEDANQCRTLWEW